VEKRNYPLVKWTKLVMPKDLGGWGIKNLVWFCQELAPKIMWRLLHNDMLWVKVRTSKYLPGMTFLEWIRTPLKNTQNCLICWKALVEAFPLIGRHIVWSVGNGK